MNKDNDKTIRGIFRSSKHDSETWNDRVEYVRTYEKKYSIGQKGKVDFFLSAFPDASDDLVHDIISWIDDSDLYVKYFPESINAKIAIYENSFGMSKDMNGYFSCDRCGKSLHALNVALKTGSLCSKCEKDFTQENKVFKL